ncbi:hypothetical protein FRC09_004082 [Ceratobasidium sp. 395]|nr:hypothetical protein FRC09_004082 [Ceratobasidium sp. 395]
MRVMAHCVGRFYDISVLGTAGNPMVTVLEMLQQLPENSFERIGWIERQRKELENSAAWVRLSGKRDIFINENNCLIPGGTLFDDSYVFDFNTNIFTVNGTIHFSLLHFPLETWRNYVTQSRSDSRYLVRSAIRPTIPMESVGEASRWLTELSEDNRRLVGAEYKALLAVETLPSDWGVPDWGELSVSQTLSVKLVQAILIDHSDIFSNPDVADQRSMHNLCCWQVISAAAPSLLVCPPMSQKQLNPPDPMMVRAGYVYDPAKPHRFQGNIVMAASGYESECYRDMKERKTKSWDHVYWTLRGCLLVFCPRLDAPEYLQSEVLSSVTMLRKSPSGKSIAIIYSGKHIVAVSVDSNVIRHTPALLVHDRKLNIQSGILMMIHLLGAQLGNKTYGGLSQQHKPILKSSSGAFPDDILVEIIHYSDYETWLQLYRVSHFTRSVCLMHPRINDSTLLRAIDGGFMTRDRSTGFQHPAYMRRVEWQIHKHNLDTTFHLRQESLVTREQKNLGITVLLPNQDLYKHFTESRKTGEMTHAGNSRLLAIWGQWIMEYGTTTNERRAATPKYPAYWRPGIFRDEDLEANNE